MAGVETTTVNGAAGLRLLLDDELDTIATMRIDGDKVTGLYFVRNPQQQPRARGRRGATLPLMTRVARVSRRAQGALLDHRWWVTVWLTKRQGSARRR